MSGNQTSVTSDSRPQICYAAQDIEERFGFRSGKFTRVNTLLSLALGLACTILLYASLLPASQTYVGGLFTRRGPTPYAIALLTFWSLATIFLKWRKLLLQRRALGFDVLPDDPQFVLSAATANQVVERIYTLADDPSRFVVFHRILIALANLRNLGRIADVDDVLRSEAENEASYLETSYALLRAFIWAIPVLGFIGTVLGLSQAIGAFGEVLAATEELGEITSSLQSVTAGLATAFDTTLLALVLALAIQLLAAFVKKKEEEFLHECDDYCLRNIVNRLRVHPFEPEEE